MKRYLRSHLIVLSVVFYIFALLGCVSLKEKARGIAGVSTKVLEDNRDSAITKTFNYDYNTCYNKVKKILTDAGSYIYAQDSGQHMLAIYVSEQDTTVVGIFFKVVDTNNTQVEVSSPSAYAKELISKRIFSGLGG